MGVRVPPFAPFFSFNDLRLILVCATFPVVSVRLRLGCVLLRGGESVQTIDEADVPSRNQMDVFVRCDLDGTVSHLIANVWQRSACLDQQTPESMPQVVEPDAPQPRTLESGKEVSLPDRPRANGVRIFARDKVIGDRRSSCRNSRDISTRRLRFPFGVLNCPR
jgi:hypothetical protein